MTIKPLPPHSGIRFHRTDLPGCPQIPARLENVVDTRLATTIGRDAYTVSTIEHLMSALAGMGIDNAMVELDGPEVPVMDGSAGPFMYLLKNVGIGVQDKAKRFFLIRKPFTFKNGDKRISVYPSRELKISYVIDFDHPLLAEQTYEFSLSGPSFLKEISRARTFGFLRDVETLKSNGFAQGGSLDNAIVLDDYRVLNADGLRYEDEFVRHKILDLIGDLHLLGMPIIGHFVVNKSGHALNYTFLSELSRKRKYWTVVEFSDPRAYESCQISVPTFAFPQPAAL
jgi:UDP-3-O-[3-hydroxymyristoyl] N-acetylglucosamine deacetylase